MAWVHFLLLFLSVSVPKLAKGNEEAKSPKDSSPELRQAWSMLATYMEEEPSDVWSVYQAIMEEISDPSEEGSDFEMADFEVNCSGGWKEEAKNPKDSSPELRQAWSMLAEYMEEEPSDVWSVYQAIVEEMSDFSEEESDFEMADFEVNCSGGWKAHNSDGNDQRTLDDLLSDLNCTQVFSEARPVHNESTWLFLRGAYQATVGPDASTISDNIYTDGFHVPVYVDNINGKGRGVFAQESIANGTTIWKKYQTARFTDGSDYRHFLLSLPSDLACDVMKWAYVMEPKDGVFSIGVDLDEGSFVNTVNSTAELNMVERPGLGLVAARDIPAGEELLVDYDSFFLKNAWSYFGL